MDKEGINMDFFAIRNESLEKLRETVIKNLKKTFDGVNSFILFADCFRETIFFKQ